MFVVGGLIMGLIYKWCLYWDIKYYTLIAYLLREKDFDFNKYIQKEYGIMDLLSYTIGLIPLFVIAFIGTPIIYVWEYRIKKMKFKKIVFRDD